MAVALRASANATTGAAAAQFLTINKPAGTATGDTMLAHIAVDGGSNVRVLAPPGWYQTRQTNSTTSLSLLTFQRQASATEAATYTWVFDAVRNACGVVRAYYENTAGLYCRIISETGNNTASAVGHAAATRTSNVAGQVMVCAFAAKVSDTWTSDVLQTESDDTNTFSGAGDVCLEAADDVLGGTGATGVRTSTLDGGVAAVGCTHSCLISTGGMSQPAGTSTAVLGTITIYDNALSENGTYFNVLDELAVSFPNDCTPSGTTNTRASYRLKVSVFWGIVGQTNTTTLRIGARHVSQDLGRNFAIAAGHTGANCYVIFGTKVGTGDEGGGVNGAWISSGAASSSWQSAQLALYGCAVENVGLMTLATTANDIYNPSEIMSCLISPRSTASNASILIGGANPIGSLYGTIISPYSGGLASGNAVTTFNALAATKNQLCSDRHRALLGSAGISDVNTKDMTLTGTTSQSDFRWIGAVNSGLEWIRPVWTGLGPKCSTSTSGVPTLANASGELWKAQVKVVDSLGAGVAGIAVRDTDVLGNSVFDTTSNANGQVAFGSGTKINMVRVMDHYSVGTTYTQRHRGPFRREVNWPSSPSYNPAYASQDYYYKWPGAETITTSSGTFEDVNDVIVMAAPVAPAAPPTPILASDVPVAADGEIRFQVAVPSEV